MAAIEVPPSWAEALDRIVSSGGCYLVLGGTDTGKSTFCRLAVERLRTAGKVPALVDGDIGQSQFGVPGTIFGLRWGGPQSKEQQTLATFFVGAVSPRGAALQCLAGICRVTSVLRAARSDALLVDTTGYIRGPAAVELKQAKVAALQPAAIVLIQRGREAETIVQAGPCADDQVWRLECPAAVAVRSREQRRERRRAKFARYFSKASAYLLGLAEKRICTGGLPAFEMWLPREGLPLTDADRAALFQQALLRYPGLLVGLRDARTQLRGLGLLTVLEASGGRAEIFSPVGPDEFETIQLGLMTLNRSGEETARVEVFGE